MRLTSLTASSNVCITCPKVSKLCSGGCQSLRCCTCLHQYLYVHLITSSARLCPPPLAQSSLFWRNWRSNRVSQCQIEKYSQQNTSRATSNINETDRWEISETERPSLSSQSAASHSVVPEQAMCSVNLASALVQVQLPHRHATLHRHGFGECDRWMGDEASRQSNILISAALLKWSLAPGGRSLAF
jgi:hypothetical protein